MCVLWNGFYNGGFPAFADLQSSALNPLIAVGALLWGAVNSAKFGIICALIIVGLAQWWMARVMHLGWVARLWIGLMAPICGHLGGTLHNGATNVTISLAFASLLLAPLMDLGINHNRRVIPWISVIVSFLLVSGQGYIQVVSF